jgi:protein-tyrosine-phosphatase
VTKRLSLCGLPGETKKALAKNVLPLTVAMGIAALPNQKLQAETTATAITLAEGGYKAEEILEKLRAEVVRPLAGVPFKLTDADLVPEAGACSKCPYNSTNAQMPGLFDNAKAGATCAKVTCLDEKLMAAWKRDAAQYVERGAKLLSLSESARIFRGSAETLDSASKYVVLNAVAPQDKSKRTWSELLSKAKVDEGVVKHPQTYVARDGKGNARVLCLAEACRTIVAERLKLKWAMDVEGTEEAAPTGAKTDAEVRARSAMTEARHKVADQATVKIAKAIAASGLKLPHLKALIDERDIDEFAEAIGMDTKTRKAFDKAATTNQIAAVAWFSKVQWGWQADEWNEHLLALCKSEGIDLDAMLKAQLDGAKAEALMTKKAG